MPEKSIAERIDAAIGRVRDQKSFIQELLIDTLQWNIDESAEEVEQIAFDWSAAELQAEELDKKLVDGVVRQLRPMKGNPFGIFILEFENPDVFTTGRGMTGPLRKVLRGLVPKRRKKSSLKSFRQENLLFICNHNYEHYRFAYFRAPQEKGGTPPLAAFGWGPNDPRRTLCEHNLPALIWPANATSLNEAGWVSAWSEAFDVERVTTRFYTEYAAAFDKVKKLIGREKDLTGDDLHLFTQSLFNRLMFLRFIERKGWLKFNDRTDYLQTLFQASGVAGKSFYQGRLAPLFFEGLAIEGRQSSKAYGEVKFLNGGLFERSDLDRRAREIPNEAFAPIIGPDGLFYRFNFTVEESTPLDIEVAVDPEMLGKVFEELVTGRHESGSYYTPRPVVSFMCREALKGVLSENTTISSEKIGSLVDRHDVTLMRESDARQVLETLDELKAVDPACGSGAYLLGLLHEIVALYRQLYSEKLVKDPRSLYDLKLRIISQNLYGVDIDPFATNIAMLRLWLSLAVEADDPIPLPNLDFKIETGDSLLAPDPQEMPDLFRVRLQAQANGLVAAKRSYLESHGDDKAALRKSIQAVEAELRNELQGYLGEGIVDWRIQFAEAFMTGRGGFDVVVANPPYVNMFSQETNAPEYRAALRANFETARGGFDIFVPFMERGVQLLRDKGVLAYITPNKLLSAKYADGLRKYFSTRTQLHSLTDLSRIPVFGAAVYPFITVAQKRAKAPKEARVEIFTAADDGSARISIQHVHTSSLSAAHNSNGSWSPLVDQDAGEISSVLSAPTKLSQVATVSASATVDEAYKWKAAISDTDSARAATSGTRFVPFIVSGNVRPFFHTWGKERVRYLKQSYVRPVIDSQHPAVSAKRQGQMFAEKIVASGMSKRPTCTFIRHPIASGVATVLIVPGKEYDGMFLAALINSALMERVYRVMFGSLSLAGGFMRFGVPQFELLPIPSASKFEQRAVAKLLERGTTDSGEMSECVIQEIDERIETLFGIK